MKISSSIRIVLLLLTFIGAAKMSWLSWLWHRHSDKKPVHVEHANYNQYQNGGSYPWPYHCSKLPLQLNPYPAQPVYDPYYYPVYWRTMLVKPIVPNVPAPFFPHQQKRTPPAWHGQQLLTGNGLLRHDLGVRRGPIHSALPPHTGQPQPVVVAHNGIFILNNHAGTGSAEAIHVSRTKKLGTSSEQGRQLKAQPNALLIL